MLTILQAAYLHEGVIKTLPRPYRHPDIFLSMTGVSDGYVAGFLTSEGKFVDRKEAYEIALRGNAWIPSMETEATSGKSGYSPKVGKGSKRRS